MLKASEKLAVVMPVYNEREAIAPVLGKWVDALDALCVDYEIRPYNDGSLDDSLDVMRLSAQRLGSRINVHDKPNGGHGNTILTGYREAVADGFDWIFQVDSDDEMGPERFAELWSCRSDYDFIVGRRWGRKQALARKIISFLSRICVRVFYGKSVWDVNAPYRLMRVSAFRDFYSQIPLTTFAPNVILSGLAARHGLRCLEINVPQHDRTTGEVSIKKWKLAKAAAMSFVQTGRFALSDRMACGMATGIFLSVMLCCASLATINMTSFATCDEIGTADTAINCVQRGVYDSKVWFYTYHPLHFWLLWLWLKAFGVSHGIVCGLNVCLALAVFVALMFALKRRGVALGGWGAASLCFLYWGGWKLAFVMQMGRIDILVMFFTLLVADAFLPDENNESRGVRSIVVYAFLLMLSGIYTVPFMILSSPLIAMLYRDKRMFFAKFVRMIIGFSLSFFIVCTYYFHRGTFLEFIYTYFQFNSVMTGISELQGPSRVLSAYFLDLQALVFFLAGVVLLSFGKSKVSKPLVALTGLTPLLMVMSGRFMDYYAWVFYVPSALLVVYAMLQLDGGRAIRCFCCIAAVMAFIRPVHEWSTEKRDAMDEGERFVMEHRDLFARDAVVVLADDIAFPDGTAIENIFYYPLVRRRVCVWRRDGDALSSRPSFQEKVDALVSQLFQSRRLRSFVTRFCHFLYQKPNVQGWPSEGVLLVRNKRTFHECIGKLQQEKADVHMVDQRKNVNCAVFSRKR